MAKRRERKREADAPAAAKGEPKGPGRIASMIDYPGGWVLMILIATALAMIAAGQGWIVCLVILALILAVPLGMAADGAKRRLKVPRPVTLTVIPVGVIVVILAALALGGIQIGDAISDHLAEAERRAALPPEPGGTGAASPGLPAAPTQPATGEEPSLGIKTARIVYRDWMAKWTTIEDMGWTIDNWLKTAHRFFGQLASQLLSGLSGVVTGLGVLLVSALIAAEPKKYYAVFITLFPPTLRPRIEPVAQEVGRRLGRWAVARGISATALAIMTWIGLQISGVRWAAGLGLITGLTSFIPVIGTIIGGLVAFLTVLVTREGSWVGVLIVFVAANAVETYVLLPVLLRRAANIPPGLTIGSLLIMGTIGGLPGMLIASPLVLMITTVAETSRDERIPIPGEPPPASSSGRRGKKGSDPFCAKHPPGLQAKGV